MKRGRSLVAGKAQVSSIWPCSWAFCPSKGVTFQEGAGAWETQPAARKAGFHVPLYSSSRESREGWTSRIWWEEGWTRASELPDREAGARHFPSLKLLQGEKNGKKGLCYICQIAQGSLSGCSHREAWSVSSYSVIWDTRSLSLKSKYLEELKNNFFFFFPQFSLSFAVSYFSLLSQGHGSDYSFGWSIWKIILLCLIPRCSWVKLHMPFHITIWFLISRLL